MSLYPEGHPPFLPRGLVMDEFTADSVRDIAHERRLERRLNGASWSFSFSRLYVERLRAELFRAEHLIDRQPLPSIDVYAYLPHDVGAMLETLKAAQHGSVANVDFGGQIRHSGISHAMTYRPPNSRKSTCATAPSSSSMRSCHAPILCNGVPAASGADGARTSLARNLDARWSDGLMLGQPQLQQAVFGGSLDLLGGHLGGQEEGALEGPVGALLPIVLPLLDGCIRLALPAQGQRILVELDVEVLFGDTWQLDPHHDGVTRVIDLDWRRPGAAGPDVRLAAGLPKELLEEAVHLLARRPYISHRIPPCQCHGVCPPFPGAVPCSDTRSVPAGRWSCAHSDVHNVLPAVRHEQGCCRKCRFWGTNPTLVYQQLNGLRTPKLLKKHICDRTRSTA